MKHGIIRPIRIYTEASEFTGDFTKDKVSFVKAFHPLVENNIRELYINEKDEIIDTSLIESKKLRLTQRFLEVTHPRNGVSCEKRSNK
jgi:hypothetical protein